MFVPGYLANLTTLSLGRDLGELVGTSSICHLFIGDQGAWAIPYSAQGLEINTQAGVSGAGEDSRPLEELVRGAECPVSPGRSWAHSCGCCWASAWAAPEQVRAFLPGTRLPRLLFGAGGSVLLSDLNALTGLSSCYILRWHLHCTFVGLLIVMRLWNHLCDKDLGLQWRQGLYPWLLPQCPAHRQSFLNVYGVNTCNTSSTQQGQLFLFSLSNVPH